MPSPRHRTARQAAAAQERSDSAVAMCSLDIPSPARRLYDQHVGEVETAGLAPDRSGSPEASVFKRVRAWHREHWFIAPFHELRLDFLNYRLQVKCAGRKGPAWLKEHEAAVRRFVRDAWSERVMMNNLITFWRANKPAAMLLRPEDVTYVDALGIEVLRYLIRLTPKQRESLAEALRTRYASGEVTLGDEKHREFNARHRTLAEQFRVWKTSPVGHGLAWPSLVSAFRTLSQSDSMEVGESAYAFAGRLVLRHVKVGHEIRSGDKAGRKDHFYTDKAGLVLEKFLKGAVGQRDMVTNFDRHVEYVWLDPKKYDVAKWDTVTRRLACWGGPLALMLTAKNSVPDIHNALKVQCLEMRRELQPWLETVVAEAFQAEGEVTLKWGGECFAPARLHAEMVKFLTTTGPGSLKTAVEETFGEGAFERELANKKAEIKEAEHLVPLHSASHDHGLGGGGKPPLTDGGGRPKKGGTSEIGDGGAEIGGGNAA